MAFKECVQNQVQLGEDLANGADKEKMVMKGDT
jgi:hypothetical protein